MSGSVFETIGKRGMLKVGRSIFVPWAMRNRNGELVGFEIDVAKKVARDMGVDVEFVPTPWEGLIPVLIAAGFEVHGKVSLPVADEVHDRAGYGVFKYLKCSLR